MAIQATGRATFTAVEDYDIVFVLNGVRCNTLNFDSVRPAESAVLEADFTNGGAPCVVDRAVLACYDGEGTLMGSSIEVHDSSSAVADGGNLYLSKDCRSISCEIYQGEKRLCARSITVVRNGSGVSVKAVAYKVLNNVAAGAALNWDSVQSQANYPTQKPDKGKYCYVMTIVLYTDGTTTNSVSTSYTPMDGTPATVYTIEPCGSISASGMLKDANTIRVTVKGNVKAYKTTGDKKEEYSSQPQSWRLSIGGANYDGTTTFNNNASNNIISFSLTQDYSISGTVPGAANIALFSDSSHSKQLASLIVPVSLNAGAIVDVNSKLGTIQSTTSSMQDTVNGMHGTIETIRQGQGKISLKVGSIEKSGGNLIYGGDVEGVYKKAYQIFQMPIAELKAGITYTMSAKAWINSNSSNGHVIAMSAFHLDSSGKWDCGLRATFDNTSSQVDTFAFTPTRDYSDGRTYVSIYEQTSASEGTDPGSYNGIHVDWVRVDQGDLTSNPPTEWEPNAKDYDAVNLIPDPNFTNSTWALSEEGATREVAGSDSAMSYYEDSDYGYHGMRIKRTGQATDIYDGLRYFIPYQGEGYYTLSAFMKDLGTYENSGAFAVEMHSSDGTHRLKSVPLYINKSSSQQGYIYKSVSAYFASSGTNSSGVAVDVKYIEVRVYLNNNGDVAVSRLCLAKSDHPVHWNSNYYRSKDDLLATGIDIKSHKITVTADNFKVRNNKGEETTAVDAQGNLTAGSLTCTDKVSGTVMSIMNGFFSALKGKAGVSLGVDKNGYPCLVGTDPNGNVLWRLGQTYETADQDSKVTMEVVSMKAYGQMNSYAIGEGVILTLNVTNNTNAAITINTSNMHMVLRSEFGNYRGNVDVATNISCGATAQVVLRGTKATDTSSSSSAYTTPVGRSVTAVVVYQGDMRLTQDAVYQEMEGLRKDSDGNVQYTLRLM